MIMINLCILLAAISFLLSSMLFFWALIIRYNLKRKQMSMRDGMDKEDPFDSEEMKDIDPGSARTYKIVTRLWGVSVLVCALFVAAAFLVR